MNVCVREKESVRARAKNFSCACVQLILRLVGQAYSVQNLVTDLPNVLLARRQIMQAMLNTSYLIASSEALLQEGVIDYPVENVGGAIVSGPFAGRSLWRVILRFPTSQVDMAAVATGSIFDSSLFWNSVLASENVIQMNTVQRCENDRRVTCNTDADCIGAARCMLDRPDIEMEIKSEGGATAPLQVTSSGADVLSVDYDMMEAAFKIRMRYDSTIKNVINSVFLSHITSPASTTEMATFNNDEFPCLPMGVGQFQQQRENSGTPSLCCFLPPACVRACVRLYLCSSLRDPREILTSRVFACPARSVLSGQLLRRLHHTCELWRVHQRPEPAAQVGD